MILYEYTRYLCYAYYFGDLIKPKWDIKLGKCKTPFSLVLTGVKWQYFSKKKKCWQMDVDEQASNGDNSCTYINCFFTLNILVHSVKETV